MAYILCIETATEVCSVALFKNDTLLHLKEIKDGNRHANELTILIQKVMNSADISLNKLDAVAVSKGPGSYTGLRVGVSTAKGICYTLQKPLIAINTLQSIANQFIEDNPTYSGLICPMIDARRMEVYTAIFDINGNLKTPTEAKIIHENSFDEILLSNKIAFIGNGHEKCKPMLQHVNAEFYSIVCSAKGIGKLAYSKYLENKFEDVAYFEPYYLKDFVGTKPRKN
ncbi:MAG: tRNA (adenosine(37)-N6)-threonylcarbamoyltransferase complex dimerization subunit type 1 TsaB [Bacteroidia bacterium]|nr:tRNA (adenosine(37)-N6)-threonylcarbamoyltransferase complex dimerization subunit type 1 TsaB [Bacteroidia bacterium]